MTKVIDSDTNPHTIIRNEIYLRAYTLENRIAGHLEKRIAEEENTRGPTINSRRDREVCIHLDGGEAQVGPVDTGESVADHKERNDPQRDLVEVRISEVRSLIRHWRYSLCVC